MVVDGNDQRKCDVVHRGAACGMTFVELVVVPTVGTKVGTNIGYLDTNIGTNFSTCVELSLSNFKRRIHVMYMCCKYLGTRRW